MGFAEPGFIPHRIPLHIADIPPVTNEKGEAFLCNLWRELGLSGSEEAGQIARDKSAIAIALEWERGGEVFLHTNNLPEEVWKSGLPGAPQDVPGGSDPADGPVRVKPLEHYMSGGVCVDNQLATGIPGLFACGEVTGGTDGAKRIGGNAVSMIGVHGFRVAEAALAAGLPAYPRARVSNAVRAVWPG